MLGKSIIMLINLLVFVVFTNISTFTVNRFGISLLPVIVLLLVGALLFKILTSPSYRLPNYELPPVYVVNFFFLIFLSIGLINANMDKAYHEIYLLMTGFIVLHLILLTVQTEKELNILLGTILICGPLLTLQGGYQFIQEISGAAGDYSTIRAAGWWTDPNTFAIILNLIYLVSFYAIDHRDVFFRWLGYTAQISAGMGILISLSRGGGVVFTLISLLGWRTFQRHKIYLIILMIFGLVLYLGVLDNIFHVELFEKIHVERFFSETGSGDDITNGRLTTAISGLMIFSRHPFAGAGFGNILDYAYDLNHIKLYTHNMFIEILAVSGLLPFLAYLLMLGFFWFELSRAHPAGIILKRFILVLAAMGIFSHYLLYMKPVWVLLALCCVCIRLTGRKNYASCHDHSKI